MPKKYDDHVIFNGHDLSDLVMCKVSRSVLPTMNPETIAVTGADGEIFAGSTLGGGSVELEVKLRTHDRHEVEAVRHALAAALYTTKPAPLFLPDDPNRYLMAIVDGDTDLGHITSKQPGTTITFKCPDGVSYGVPHSEEFDSRYADVPGTWGAAKAYEWESIRTATWGELQTKSSSTMKTIIVGGTYPSWPLVTAKPGAADRWTIKNETTGEYLTIVRNFGSNDEILVSMSDETAFVNGQGVGITLDSDFFSISGTTVLSVTSGTATVQWRERWL